MPQLAVEREDGVAVVTITNPPMGYLDSATVPELEAVTQELEADASVRAIVLTGGLPGVFIRHYSVVELEGLSRVLRERQTVIDIEQRVPERALDVVFRRIETMPKPVIAAINGLAMGGGFELTLACDIRVAEEGDYQMGLPEVNIGILPGAGGTQKLARLVGMARALEMTLRGRTVSPKEAFELGIVQELAPAGSALIHAKALARDFADKPPLSVAHIKRLVRMTPETPLADGLALERTLFMDTLVSDDGLRLMSKMNAENLDIRHV
jgi:enoyl-CoA hydratase